MAAVTVTQLRRRRASRELRRITRWMPLALGLAAAVALFAAVRSTVGQEALGSAYATVLAVTGDLGLVVDDIEVEGRTTTDVATIIAALDARRGAPILSISPSRAKQQLEALPWVRSAVIERRFPSTLRVRLTERTPVALWQHGGKHDLVDSEGVVIPIKEYERFASLPIVVGDEAPPYTIALLEMLRRQPELAARVTAAIRVGRRRWNLRIDNATDIYLPERNPGEAWERLAELERDKGLLGRDVQLVDMRLPDRLVVRPVAPPAKEAPPVKKPHAPGRNT